MSDLMELEKKVDLLVKLVTENDSRQKETLICELRGLNGEEVNHDKPLRYIVEDFLSDFGIPSHLMGYNYIAEVICLLLENSKYFEASITKLVYPMVAKKYGSTPPRVERAIRHAIESTFEERADKDAIYRLFRNSISSKNGRPTNTEFIYRVVQVIRREVGEKNES